MGRLLMGAGITIGIFQPGFVESTAVDFLRMLRQMSAGGDREIFYGNIEYELPAQDVKNAQTTTAASMHIV